MIIIIIIIEGCGGPMANSQKLNGKSENQNHCKIIHRADMVYLQKLEGIQIAHRLDPALFPIFDHHTTVGGRPKNRPIFTQNAMYDHRHRCQHHRIIPDHHR